MRQLVLGDIVYNKDRGWWGEKRQVVRVEYDAYTFEPLDGFHQGDRSRVTKAQTEREFNDGVWHMYSPALRLPTGA